MEDKEVKIVGAFPKKYLTGMNTSQFVGAVLNRIVLTAKYILTQYYQPSADYTSDNGQLFLKSLKSDTEYLRAEICVMEHTLSRLVVQSLDGLDDMVVAQYGLGSDGIFIYRTFVSLFCRDRDPSEDIFDSAIMGKYAHADMDDRLKAILFPPKPCRAEDLKKTTDREGQSEPEES